MVAKLTEVLHKENSKRTAGQHKKTQKKALILQMSNAERVEISQRWHAYDQELTLYVYGAEKWYRKVHTETGELKKSSLAGLAKLSRLRYS